MSHDAAHGPDSIEALSNAVNELRAERDGLRQAMRHRAVIEQAKGMLAERLTITPDQAFGKLVELSSRSNVKVAELAAALVARQMPETPQTPEYLVPDAAPEPRPDPLPESTVTSEVGSAQAALQLLNSQIGSVASFDDLAHAIATATDCWARPVNVIILLPEADGALRLAGAAGLSTTARSQWDRVPPIEDLPIVSAMTNRAAVMLTDAAAIARQFPVVADRPHEALIAMPLIHEDRTVGVLEITWGEALVDGESTLSRLSVIGRSCARRCEKLAAAQEAGVPEEHPAEPATLALFMEALNEPAVLLSPVWSNDQIVDFQIELASAAARRAARSEQVNKSGGTLLTTLPQVGSRLLLPALVRAVNSGEPQRLSDVYIDGELEAISLDYQVDLHAVRLWDRVLLTWRVIPEAERLWPQLLLTEKTTHCGSIRFDTVAGAALWSPGALALLGVAPDDDPPTAEQLVAVGHDGDVAALKAAAAEARPGESVSGRVRGAGEHTGREFTVTLCSDPGEPAAITVVIRDARATGSATGEHDRVAAAAERARRAEAGDRIRELTQGAADDSIDRLTCQAVSLGQATCWSDRVKLSDSRLLFVVGEVIDGPREVVRQRLRHTAVGYALAGLPSAEILANLNLVCGRAGGAAAVSLACVDVKENRLEWAAAGRNAPILVDPTGRARLRSGALSLALGVAPDVDYQVNHVDLAPGSRLMLYSESLLTEPTAPLPQTLAALLDAASSPDVGQSARRLREDLPGEFGLCLVSADIAP